MKKDYSQPGDAHIIYNVTVKISGSVATQWLQWMLNVHIPEVMDTSCFSGYKVLRLLDTDDDEGDTYAIQYSTGSIENYKRYLNVYADNLRKKSVDKWGDSFIAFRTLMEIVK